MIKLIGIALVAVGFALRVNTLLVVLVAGVATGLVAGMSLTEILERFGASFVENRYMLLPVVLMVPLIGLLERHGLQERAVTLIRRSRAATAGRVILLYTAVRQVAIALGVRIGGHAEAVRPLVAPMAEAAARRQWEQAQGGARAGGAMPPETTDLIRATAAAGENVGNFFGEDIFIAVGAILLMKGYFDGLKWEVSIWAMALWGIPTALAAFAAMAWRARALDRRIARDAVRAAGTEGRK